MKVAYKIIALALISRAKAYQSWNYSVGHQLLWAAEDVIYRIVLRIRHFNNKASIRSDSDVIINLPPSRVHR